MVRYGCEADTGAAGAAGAARAARAAAVAAGAARDATWAATWDASEKQAELRASACALLDRLISGPVAEDAKEEE